MATTKKETPSEPKFPLDELRANSMKLYGVSVSTFDGATVGLDGTFTVAAVGNKIKAWLSEPMK